MPTNKKPSTLSDAEQQEIYDAVMAFMKALGRTVFTALGLTLGWNLATPITHLPSVAPFAVWGIIIFIDFLIFMVRLWVKAPK